MRDNVLDELRQVRSDDQTKTKMLEILKRFHSEQEEEEDDDDDEGSSSEETIQKILAGEEINLDNLSLEDRKGFKRALSSGELSKMIQPWDPWWLAPTISLGQRLVQCVEEEVLSLGSATMLLSVSSVLGQSSQPESVKEVLSFCLEQTCSSGYKNLGGGLRFGLNLVDDVIHLLSLGNAALVCLLCDLQRLVLGAIQEVESSGRDLKKKLKLADRKVFFMLCWVNEQTWQVWQALESSVRAEKDSIVELNDYKVFRDVKEKGPIRKGRVVIEEIE